MTRTPKPGLFLPWLGLGSIQIPFPGAIRRSPLRLHRASTPPCPYDSAEPGLQMCRGRRHSWSEAEA